MVFVRRGNGLPVYTNSKQPTIRVPESVRRQREPSKMQQFAVRGIRQWKSHRQGGWLVFYRGVSVRHGKSRKGFVSLVPGGVMLADEVDELCIKVCANGRSCIKRGTPIDTASWFDGAFGADSGYPATT